MIRLPLLAKIRFVKKFYHYIKYFQLRMLSFWSVAFLLLPSVGQAESINVTEKLSDATT
jgi:hypothetical protein